MSDNSTKIGEVLEALKDNEHPFPAKLLRSFSDLSRKNLRELQLIWLDLKRERRIALLEDLETLAESDTLINFEDLNKMTLTDVDPAVRVISIRSLWDSEDAKLIPVFSEMMLDDPAEDVRAAAASALGKYVYLGEVDSIPDNIHIPNVMNLIDVFTSEDLPMVRRRALESLGFSSHPKVPPLIQKAADSEDVLWLTSALYAMGRSADEQWAEMILKHLDSPDNEVLFEAIRAAGELQLDEAREPLLEKLEGENNDPDLRYAIIWSLSQIGGEGIKQLFENLIEKVSDEEEIEWLEKGLDNLELGGDLEEMEMLDLDLDKINSPDKYDPDDEDVLDGEDELSDIEDNDDDEENES